MAIDAASEQPDELRRVLQEAERSQQGSGNRNTILREDTARVSVNIWPQLIPRESVNPDLLIDAVQKQLGATLDTGNLLQKIPSEARAGISLARLLGHALQDDDELIKFQGGYLAIPESRRVTSIRDLAIGQQNLTATVVGSSSEAEYCLRQLAIIINRAAGIERVWADFEPHVELTSYLTATVVDLGAGLSRILAPEVRDFLRSEVGGEGGFGSSMGSFASFANDKKADLKVVPAVVRVEFKVAIMDTVSGRFESCSIELLSHTQSDNNRNRVKVLTELSSDDHRRFVERLVQAVERA